jgi:hypothetical protein
MATLESSETYSQPGVKKTIRRDSGRALSIFGMAATEEVQESQPPKLKALGAMVGDRARPV